MSCLSTWETHQTSFWSSYIRCFFEPFQIIHSDVWTFPVPSIGGKKYYAIFLDHYSHYVWVYPLKKKSEFFSAYMQNKFGCKIKSLQCDNSDKYNNSQFLNFFSSNGITHRFSCPHTSQQNGKALSFFHSKKNGKAELTLRTLNNFVWSLLFQDNLPPVYWVEALNIAAHLFNLLPSTAIKNEILFTKLFHKPVCYNHLRLFGCLCYPNLTSIAQHKFSPRSTACVFLGFPISHKGYRCLDLITHKVIISRQVIFDENSFHFSTNKPSSFETQSHDISPPFSSPLFREIITTSPNSDPKHMSTTTSE